VNIVGYFHGIDPAACLLMDGELVAYVEEERLVRVKHADGLFPIRSIEYCLKAGGLEVQDLDCFAYGWNAPAYSDGTIAAFYDEVNAGHPPSPGTRSWQRRNLSWFHEDSLTERLRSELVRHFGVEKIPPLRFYPHHRSHAVTAYHLSPYDEALVLTVDGSGDQHTTVVWEGRGNDLEPLWEGHIPDSLGWFYAAITEYLGFRAYDGEYKVMGLAAYGRPHAKFEAKLQQVVAPGPEGFDFTVDPRFIHHGAHTYSGRFTDELVDLLGLPPRIGTAPIEPVHEDLAFVTQQLLERTVLRLVSHFQQQTGLRRLCISGGVGLNVKMNSHLQQSGLFDDVFPFPIPSDSGVGIGAAAGIWQDETGGRVPPLRHVYLGPSFSDAEVEDILQLCGVDYRTCDDVADETAQLLASGKVVGWFQGRLEGGPRALGARSILADPRLEASRDRVNGAVKFREYWRPFCPSMTEEAAQRYLVDCDRAPYMITAHEATPAAATEIPAVVHVDGTARSQTVDRATNPRYRALLDAFERRTGVPVVLNTSFNIKGEAIVNTPRDALRTFWSTGLDALVIGNCIVEKPVAPKAAVPEDAIR
jgi:carbamoyltransferase